MNPHFYITKGPYPAFLPNLLFMEGALPPSKGDATSENHYEDPRGRAAGRLTTPQTAGEKEKGYLPTPKGNQKFKMKL